MQSHVVPKSIRNHLFGEFRPNGRKFSFEYAGRTDLPNQDFPKPELMCTTCDNGLGGTIEKDIPKLLMPKNLNDWEQWKRLGLRQVPFGSFNFYDYSDSTDFAQIERIAALTAWRAMHAMAKDGNAFVAALVASPEGVNLDQAMIAYFENKVPSSGAVLPAPSLWWLSPSQVVNVTGEDDRLPISWAALGTAGDVTLAVLFGVWLVTWKLPGAISPTDQLVLYWFEEMKMKHRKLFADRKH